MTASPGILNADMRTIGGWLRDFWRWWSGELSGLFARPSFIPAPRARPLAMADEKGRLTILHPDGRSDLATVAGVTAADLALGEEQCLEREIRLPAMSDRDLAGYLDLEGERFFPLPGATLLHDATVLEPPATDGLQLIRIGAVRRDLVEQLIAQAAQAGIQPLRIGVASKRRADSLRYDFARTLRAQGALPRLGVQRQLWWAIVAALALLNIALLVWRDQAGVDRLQALVDAQQPAVRIYRTLAERNARAETLAQRTVARQRTQQPLADLALVTEALPNIAWVQRYSWNGRALQIAGYYQGEADLLAALRRAPRLAGAQATGSSDQADIPTGHPFDISIDLAGAGR